jgi:hypothetical protein
MAQKMAHECRVCGAVPSSGSGKRLAAESMARHIASAHPNLTEAEKDALARQLRSPLSFVDAVMAAGRKKKG